MARTRATKRRSKKGGRFATEPSKAASESLTPAWRVYVLCCGDGTLYTGATNDLDRRVAKHARGKGAAYTRARLPVALVFSESVEDRSAALRREAALKKLTRKEKLALIRRGG